MVDSPAWRLVKALDTLVSDDGNTITIDGYPKPPPISAEEKAMIAAAAAQRSEAKAKKQYGVQHWIDDLPWQQANERLVSQPTVNIEGLVGGYTGPGGKTVLPHRAVAKIDMRLVPDMTSDAAVAALKAHLAKRGYGDIEVNVTGGYDPTSTRRRRAADPGAGRRAERAGIDPVLWPRNAGSYPGFVFTGAAAQPALGALRPRPRQRRARPGRVLRHRVDQPRSAGLRRRGDVVRRVPVRAGTVVGEASVLPDLSGYKRNLTPRCGLNRSSIRAVADCETLEPTYKEVRKSLRVGPSPNIVNATLRAHSFGTAPSSP